MEGEASVPIDYQVPLPQDWVPSDTGCGCPQEWVRAAWNA